MTTDRVRRRSPPAERIVAVLEFLARRPTERFSLSELASEARLDKATCLGIAVSLSEAGYLVRDPDTKSYSLGPGLANLARAAEAGSMPRALIRGRLMELSESTGLPAIAASRFAQHSIILERTGPPCDLDALLGVGRRVPMDFSSGKWTMVWFDDDAIRHWLGLLAPSDRPSRAGLASFRSAVDFARDHGHLVVGLHPGGPLVQSLIALLPVDAVPDSALGRPEMSGADALLTGPRSGDRYSVHTIHAPVRSPQGSLLLLVTAYVLSDDVAGDTLRSHIVRLKEVTRLLAADLTTDVGLIGDGSGRAGVDGPWHRC